HYGLRDRVSRRGKTALYPARKLLGFTDNTSNLIFEILLKSLGK
ncbi:TPA: phage virion morphogenesis protein, partial [Klebsiella pneumoniae]|nr:phage virion morphogenesis protein [Klebsiella pneumoniae]